MPPENVKSTKNVIFFKIFERALAVKERKKTNGKDGWMTRIITSVSAPPSLQHLIKADKGEKFSLCLQLRGQVTSWGLRRQNTRLLQTTDNSREGG